MRKVTVKPSTQHATKVTKTMNDSHKETLKRKVKRVQCSQMVEDSSDRATRFKTITEAILNLAIAAIIITMIGFAIYTGNPLLLAPETFVPQLVPEIPQVTPEARIKV